MKEHIEVCPNQVVMCKYVEFGCDEKEIKCKNYDQHLSSAVEQHLCLVAEYAKREKDARKNLEVKMDALERRLNEFVKK